jgi:LmbE family N-acetylglucosaminyl deacetylase
MLAVGERRGLGRWQAVAILLPAVLLGASLSVGGWSSSAHAAGTRRTRMAPRGWSRPAWCARGAVLNIVAHEDDDLLFLSPDLLGDITARKCVTTVFVTAGDAGQPIRASTGAPVPYWQTREAGSRAAYAFMAYVRNAWTERVLSVAGHRLAMFSLTADPRVSEIFMRLPDGGVRGEGFPTTGYESLLKLRAGAIDRMQAIDGSASYTKRGLLQTMTALLKVVRPTVIRTQDYVVGDYTLNGDHSDHTSTAQLAQAASAAYRPLHVLVGYTDYATAGLPANLKPRVIAAKQAAFDLYDEYDTLLPCHTPALQLQQPCLDVAAWLAREYPVQIGPGWNELCFIPTVAGPTAPGGLPLSAGVAESMIRAQGCSVGTVSSAPSDLVPAGYVISQDPQSGPSFLPQGTTINLTVSTGPPTSAHPALSPHPTSPARKRSSA